MLTSFQHISHTIEALATLQAMASALLIQPHVNLLVQGYNGSQLWDTAFTAQAYVATGLLDAAAESLQRAHTYLSDAQVHHPTP